MHKQAIIVRQDLKMPKGKLSAQVAHASIEAAYSCDQSVVSDWREEGAKKIVLKVKDAEELVSYIKRARKENIPSSLIKDAGHTFFKTPTITCGAVGPAEEEDIDIIIRGLKLL